MNQHSPGPWAHDDGAVYSEPLDTIEMVKDDQGAMHPHHRGLVALVYGHHVGESHHYTFADNARLIAAAPELLAALEDLTDRLERDVPAHTCPGFDCATCARPNPEDARAAIRKATASTSEPTPSRRAP